ncbi:hypothetical protein Syun_030516 [Stephania yunnanensis]|uniref:Protein NO VEIN C-terminal domain-containing protein n=1 Tax=Stephania yunnanensis TaxID=152371 RepID=A0AAP0DXH6_9MAGN
MHGRHHPFRPRGGAPSAAAPQLPSQLPFQLPPQSHPYFHPNNAYIPNAPFAAAPPFNAYNQNPNLANHQFPRNSYAAAAPPKPRFSIDRVDQAVTKAHHDLLAKGESVEAWKVAQSALLSLQVDSWRSLEVSMSQVPSLNRIMVIEGKVNAYIHCFVEVRKITTVYELGDKICKNESVERFEELELGPLLRHPLVVRYFSVPTEVKEVVKITSAEIISYLAELRNSTKNIQPKGLLEFIASKLSVPVKENLGIRIQSLGTYIHAIEDAIKSEADTLKKYVHKVEGCTLKKCVPKVEGDLLYNPRIVQVKKSIDKRFKAISQRVKSFSPIQEDSTSKHIRFCSSGSDEESDGNTEDDGESNNSVNNKSEVSFQNGKGKSPSTCPYPSAIEEMVRLGLKTDTCIASSTASGSSRSNESKKMLKKKRKRYHSADDPSINKLHKRGKDDFFYKPDDVTLLLDKKVKKIKAAESQPSCNDMVEHESIQLSSSTMETFIATWKEACKMHSIEEVSSMRRGMCNSLYDTLQGVGEDETPTPNFPPAEIERVEVEMSCDKNSLSVEEPSSLPKCNVTVDDILVILAEHFQLSNDCPLFIVACPKTCVSKDRIVGGGTSYMLGVCLVSGDVTVDDILVKLAEYFQLSSATLRADKMVQDKNMVCLRKLHNCEIWLTKQFFVKEFVSLGCGEFLRFLQDHPFLLPNIFGDDYSEGVSANYPVEASIHSDQLGMLVSQAASNLWKDDTVKKQDITAILKQQFPLISFEVVSNGILECSSEFTNKLRGGSTSGCILFSAALGMYSSWNTMMQSTNVLVESCDMKVDSSDRVGALGSVSAKEALECLLKAPMLSDLQSWTHWNHVFAPSLGSLLEWLSKESCTKELLCLVTKDGKIIRIDHSASVDEFLDALLKGSSFQTAVKLLSLYALYGGKQHVPLSLLKSHAQRAMEVILKSSVDRAAVQSRCEELNGETTVYLPAFMHIKKGDPSDNQFNEPVFLASRFVLECLGHLPSEFCSFAADVLLSGLRALTKEAPLVMLHACDKINERLMLHDIGFSLDIPEWVADCTSFVASDFFMSTDASMANPLSMTLNFDQNLTSNKSVLCRFDCKSAASLDERNDSFCEIMGAKDINELSTEQCNGVEESVVLGSSGNQEADLIIESIRREEFGLVPGLTDAESLILNKQHARLGRALHCLSQELYSQDSHFLLELVQNADDNVYPENVEPTIVFIMQSSEIIVLNNERGFSAQNIRALCDVGSSTKKGSSAGYIGQKGIGFKSVFRVTDAPEIHSNGFHVKFDIGEGQIGFVLPSLVPSCDLDSFKKLVPGEVNQTKTGTWNTCIVLPFKREIREGNGTRKIMSMFLDFHPSLLLFLHRLRVIKLKNMLDGSSVVMKRETVGDGIIRVSHGKEKMSWFVATKELMASAIRPDVRTTEIAIAFTLQESSHGEYIPQLDQQPVFAFLPLRTYGLKFILQGDFVLPSSREEVDGDSAWNQWLLSEFPGLFVCALRSFSALSCFQDSPGKAVTAFMSFVPLEGEVHGFFSRLPRMIISKLRTSSCMLLEGHTMELVPPCRILRGWNDQARILFPDSLLNEHLGLGYLDREIILSDQLAKALGVHDYGPKILIDFLSSLCRTDNGVKSLGVEWLSRWLNTLYIMLVPTSCTGSLNTIVESDLTKSLQTIPFIPLSDGSYGSIAQGTIWLPCDVSTGFDSELFLEAFPNLYAEIRTVSPTLLSAAVRAISNIGENSIENITRMLQKIGIQRLSAHQIVKMHILPALCDDKIITRDRILMTEYLSFIMVHFHSGCNSCSVEREHIMSELKDRAFILTNHGFRRPADVSIHFGIEFGNRLTTKSLSNGIAKWREFFQEFGLSDFVQIILVEKNIADVPPSVLRDIMRKGDPVVPNSIVKDWESPELVHILSTLSSQNNQEKSKYLLEVLDKMWDDYFSTKVSGSCTCGTAEGLKLFESSVLRSIHEYKWLASTMDQLLHYPRDLYFDCEEVRSVLGGFAPYVVPQKKVYFLSKLWVEFQFFGKDDGCNSVLIQELKKVRNQKLLDDIGFKTLVTLDDALELLESWGKSKSPFKASIAQMSRFYSFIWNGISTSKAKIAEVFRAGPSVFVPVTVDSRHHEVVSGIFLSPSEVYWHDSTGSMVETKKLIFQCSSVNETSCPLSRTLADIYQGLHSFFVHECGVHEIPPFRSYIEILVQLSNNVLPSQAANIVLRILMKWADDLKSGSVDPEDIIHLKESLLTLEYTLLPTVHDKWVSLHPSFGLFCWCDDEDLRKEFTHSENLNFLHFGDLSKEEKEMLPAKLMDLMQALGIPSLSQVITREAIFYGIEDCTDKALLVNWALPYAQRYLFKLHPDVYMQLKHSGSENLSRLQENILYITRASDTHSIFLELSRLFFKGACNLHLANFLHMITTMGESGSTEELIEQFVLNNQKVPKLPDNEPFWLVSSISSVLPENEIPQPISALSYSEDQNPLKAKRKPVNISPSWPPADWKIAPDFNFARENQFRTRPWAPQPSVNLQGGEISDVVISNNDQDLPFAIEVDWVAQEDLTANNEALLAMQNFKGQDGNALPGSHDPVYGMVSDGSEMLRNQGDMVSIPDNLDISQTDERHQLSFGMPNAYQAALTGRLGELVAFQYFTNKVCNTNVRWVNKEVETGLPYDIVIGDDDESKEYIEVKATKSLRKDWFTISNREWQFAVEKGDSFSIAHVVLLGQNNAKVTVFKNPLRLCQQGIFHLAVLMQHHPKEMASAPSD